MKIVVAGGAGAMALSAIIYCLEQRDVTEVVVADLDKSKVKDRIAQLNDSRVVGEVLNLKDIKASAKVFKGASAVLNTALKDSCLPAMEAALEAGINYTDISGPPEERLILDQPFKEKRITAVVCLGTAPGMSNIMAAYAIDKLDSVQSIEMKDVCANLVPHHEHSRALYWGFAIESIIREFSSEAQVMENGEIKLYPPLAQAEIVAFRPPVGPAQVAVTAHPEIAMFARSFKDKGLKNATWKIGFEPEFEAKMKFLCALGFHKEEHISVDGLRVSPRAVLLSLLKNQPPETKRSPDFRGHMIVVVKGEEKGQKVEYTLTEYATAALTEKMQKRGVFSSYRTGIYAAIATMMVARGQAEKKGVLYPETSIPATQFMKEVVRYGIEVEVTKKIVVDV
jgi:saccharopine dehydrogenase-like NADP-dependent oxidoreductase